MQTHDDPKGFVPPTAPANPAPAKFSARDKLRGKVPPEHWSKKQLAKEVRELYHIAAIVQKEADDLRDLVQGTEGTAMGLARLASARGFDAVEDPSKDVTECVTLLHEAIKAVSVAPATPLEAGKHMRRICEDITHATVRLARAASVLVADAQKTKDTENRQ